MAEKSNRTKITIGIAVIIGIMILSYVLFPSGGRRVSTSPSEEELLGDFIAPGTAEGIATVLDIIEEETDTYIINIQYSIITGMTDEEKQISLNQNVKDFATKPINNFKSQTENFEVIEGMKSGLYLESDVIYLSEELISIRFIASEYMSGAAHPSIYNLVFNYDILENKEIELKDLFLPGVDYLTLISILTREDLFNQFKDDLELMQGSIQSGTEGREENFQNFAFTEESLVIYFDAYQVAPYALGIQIVEIPFEELSTYMDPEGPLNNLISPSAQNELLILKNMKLQSSAFENQGNIPSKYTCDGEDVNPALSISEVPEGTQSLVLIADDPDASAGTWVHWVIFNIAPTTALIEENSVPQGAVQGLNDFGKETYGGPCPPSGSHRYLFKLYALDSSLELEAGSKKQDIENSMQGHILEQAELVGLYQRQ